MSTFRSTPSARKPFSLSRKIRFLASSVSLLLLAATGYAQTTSVSKTYTTSGSIVFGAGVTTVNVSMWGGGGGGSAGGMKEFVNSVDYRLHYGSGGGGANWAGASVSVTPGSIYPIIVGTGGAAGGLDGDGLPMSGGNGTQSLFQGVSSPGGSGGYIVGFNAFGGARGSNPVPDAGTSYAQNGANEGISTGGNGGRSNNSPYGPSGTDRFNESGLGWPQVMGVNTGGPGTRPGDGGGGGGMETLLFPLEGVLARRIPGGRGANGIVTFYITYPTYRLTAAPVATKLCGPGASVITLRSSTLATGAYTVTYNTSNPATTGNTVVMLFNSTTGTGTFSTIPLTGTSTITITNLASGNTCSDAITQNNTVTAVVENTVTNSWLKHIDIGGAARSNAVSFTIGDKAYVGTGKNGSTLMNDFWQFDQATGTWTQVANFAGGVRTDAVGMGIGTKGYVGTGSDGTNVKNDFWEYDPFTNVWTAKAPIVGQPRHSAVAVTIGSKGYITLGTNGTSHYIDMLEYDPVANTWVSKALFANNAPGAGRTKAIAFSIGIKAYVGTGLNNLGAYTKDLWEYDVTTNIWTQKASLPGDPRSGAVAFSIGSKGFVGTGSTGSANLNDFYEYNPANNGWLTTAAFGGGARAFGVGFSLSSKGFAGLGVASATSYSDLYEFTAGRPVIRTGSVSASAFCQGVTLNIPFSTGCPGGFNGENQFVAQLSDKYGSFVSPVTIGSTTSAAGSISATIPANTPVGAGYRIRVVGTSPETIGNDNGVNLGIKGSIASAVTAGINKTAICRGEAVNLTATVSAGGSSDTSILLSENFNSGAPAWLITLANSYPADAGITEILDNGERGAHSNDNSSFYGTISSGRFSTDVTNTTLQSPAISTLGVNSASLTFYHHYQYGAYNNSDSIRIQASIDNGLTWTTIYLNNSTTVGYVQDSLGFVKQTVSLNNFVNQPFLVLRFNYGAYGGLGRWYIDNIVLTGVSKSNNFSWSSAPAGFTSTQQNPTGIVPALVGASNVYTVTYSNNFGCASAQSSISVFVKDTSSSTTRLSICPSALPFTWNGLVFDNGGTQVARFVNAAGCDSLAKLILTVKPVSSSITNISICPSDLPFSWNGLQFTAAGAQTAHFTNSVGCDSAATLNLVVKPVSTFTSNLTICESALPFVWNGLTFNAAGSGTQHFQNSVGCDSAVTLNLTTIASVASASASINTICPGKAVNLFAGSGSGTTVLLLNEGFNSTHNNWTTQNLSSGGNVGAAAWTLRPNNYEPYFGQVGFTTNDNSAFYMSDSYAQGVGVTTHTILQSPLFSTVGLTNATLSFYHQFRHQSNFANDSIRVQVSNDGTTWTNLYVNKNANVGFNSQFQQQSVSLNGYLNMANLRLRFVYNGTPVQGDFPNYWWAINSVTVSGTVVPSTFSWTSSPAGFTSSVQNPTGVSPTQTTTYTVTTNNGYCFASRSVTVTVNATNPSSTSNLAICPGSLPYTWNGLVFETAGIQTAHIPTAGGCDSSATMNLTLKAASSSVTNITICPSGLPYTWNGLVFTAGGSQTKHLVNSVGCDSSAVLNLTVQTSSTSSSTTISICEGQLPFTWNGLVFTAAGQQTKLLTNSLGCDSAATLNLLVSAKPANLVAAASVSSVCAGSTFNLTASASANPVLLDEGFNTATNNWATQNLSTGGNVAAAAWTLKPANFMFLGGIPIRSNDNTQYYFSDSYSQGSGGTTNTILQSPVFSTVGYSAASLTFYQVFSNRDANDSVRVQVSTNNGTSWNTVYVKREFIGGYTSFALTTVSLNAYVNQASVMLRFQYGAANDYLWAIDNVKVTGTQSPAAFSWTSIPAGFTSSVQNPTGVSPTQTTSYIVTVNNGYCIDSSTVTVSVKPVSSSTTSLSICPSALPYSWNGLLFETAGSQTAHLTNAVGCDSAATLVLTVKAATTSTQTLNICPGALPFTWNGLTFNAAGSGTAHFTNSAGCDSAATLVLTVSPVTASATSQTICASALPYSWNGLSFDAAGTKTAHFLNSAGCDSAVSLTLTVNPLPINVTANASNTSICLGGSINLSSGSTAPVAGPSVLIMGQDFNGALNGWSTQNASSGGNPALAAWTLRSDGYEGLHSNDASQFFITNSDAQGQGGSTNSTLYSPVFSTVGYTAASLSFYHYYRNSDPNYDAAKVEISVNGGNWTPIYTATNHVMGANGSFVQQTISLNGYLNQPNVRLRFNLRCFWGWYWAIDNVQVTGTPQNTYSWTSAPAGFTSSQQNPQGLTPAVTTTYTVTVQAANGCSASQSVEVQVNPAPEATILYPFFNCVSGGTATVTQTGSTGGVYSAPAGLAIDAATGAVALSASTPGSYTVTYTIAASGTCPQFSASTDITIDPAYAITASAGAQGTISSTGSSNVCAGSNKTYTITADACARIDDVLVDGISVGPVTSYTFTDINAAHSISASFSALATLPTITAGGATTFCNGSSVVLQASAGTSYQWSRNGSPIGGATTQSFTATASGSYTVAVAGASACSAASTVSAPIVLTVTTVTAAASGSTTVCQGAAAPTITFTGAGADAPYTFTYAINGGAPQTISSSSGPSVSLAAATDQGGSFTYALLGVQSAGGCSEAVSSNATITVNVRPTATIAYAGPLSCGGTGSVPVIHSGATGGTYSSTAGLAIDAATGAIDLSGSTSGTYTVTYTLAAAGGCTAFSSTTTVTINSSFAASIAYTGSPYCALTGTVSVTRSGSSGGVYTALPAGLSIDAATGAIDLALSLPNTYTVTYSPAAGACGTATATQVSVRPTNFFGTQTNQVLCTGATVAPILFNGPAGQTYTWTNTNTAIGLAASGAGDIASFVGQNASSVLQTAYITVTALGGTGCKDSRRITFRIGVQPQPTVATVPDQVLCSGFATTPVAFSSPVAGSTFTWTNSNSSIGLGASGSGNIPSFATRNATLAQQSATIKVTPMANRCTGPVQSFSIAVTPGAGTISYGAVSYCPVGWAYVTRTGSTGGTFTSSPAGLRVDAATGAVNLALSAAGNYTITYTTGSAGSGCSTTATTQLTINSGSVVNPVSNAAYCAGAQTAAVTFTGSTGGYTWTNSNPSIGLAASGSGNIPSFTATNSSNLVQKASIKVTPLGDSSSTCAGRAITFVITVYPTPMLNTVASQPALCRGMMSAPVAFSGNGVSGVTYNWTNNETRIGLASRGIGNIPSFLVQNPTAGSLLATVTVTPIANKCAGAPIAFQYGVGTCIVQAGVSPASKDELLRAATSLQESVLVGPNPTQGSVTISFAGKESTFTVNVMDQNGRSLQKPVAFTGSRYTLDLGGYAAGAYLLELTEAGTGRTVRRTIIKL